MHRLALLAVLVFVIPILARPSAADPKERQPAPPDAARAAAVLVERELLEPLAIKERQYSRFSRARLPPDERRVRVLDEEPRLDARGDAFFRFAVDARHGVPGLAGDEAWRLGALTGCVYLARSE